MIKENFVEYINNSILENWDYPALSDYKGKDYTYAETAWRIKWIHEVFKENNIEKGDKIALLGKNSSHWAMIYLATVSYGAVIVPILPDFHANDIHHIVNHSDSKFLFVGEMVWENIDESSMAELRAIISIDDFSVKYTCRDCHMRKIVRKISDKFEKDYKDGFKKEDYTTYNVSNNEIGIINYTSGTTGFSKGVVLKNNALSANVRYARNNLPLKAGERIVSILPLAHTYGCAFEFLWPFSMGCHINFLTRTPSPKIIIQAFQTIKPSVVIAVPLIIEKIYKKQIKPTLDKKILKLLLTLPVVDKSIYQKINKKLTEVFGGNFREIVIGGAPLSREVELFLRKIKFKYAVGYGMTECGPLISYVGWEKTKFRSAGKIVDTLEIKINKENKKADTGEIMVRGENIMEGYYKNPEATKQSIDKDGWLHTGDLGSVDEDGYVFINGRSKSLILGPSGENIYPEEIEARINNQPFVMESLVLPDENKLVALVHPDYETIDNNGIHMNELPEHLEKSRKEINEELPKYKQISRIKLYPHEFEKTPKKSIKRFLYNIDS